MTGLSASSSTAPTYESMSQLHHCFYCQPFVRTCPLFANAQLRSIPSKKPSWRIHCIRSQVPLPHALSHLVCPSSTAPRVLEVLLCPHAIRQQVRAVRNLVPFLFPGLQIRLHQGQALAHSKCSIKFFCAFSFLHRYLPPLKPWEMDTPGT